MFHTTNINKDQKHDAFEGQHGKEFSKIILHYFYTAINEMHQICPKPALNDNVSVQTFYGEV